MVMVAHCSAEGLLLRFGFETKAEEAAGLCFGQTEVLHIVMLQRGALLLLLFSTMVVYMVVTEEAEMKSMGLTKMTLQSVSIMQTGVSVVPSNQIMQRHGGIEIGDRGGRFGMAKLSSIPEHVICSKHHECGEQMMFSSSWISCLIEIRLS